MLTLERSLAALNTLWSRAIRPGGHTALPGYRERLSLDVLLSGDLAPLRYSGSERDGNTSFRFIGCGGLQ